MKKVSTRAAGQSRNISAQRLTIGLDLGDRNSWYCVVDEAGQIRLEQRVRTNAKGLHEVFGAMPRSRIALEIGTHSPWISRLLSELGHEVIVANARKVRLIGESRKKDDRLDAQTLARLARIDPELLYPVKHRSVQAQADLALIRGRAGLVRARTGLVNTARGLAKSYGERLRGCNVRNIRSGRIIMTRSQKGVSTTQASPPDGIRGHGIIPRSVLRAELFVRSRNCSKHPRGLAGIGWPREQATHRK
jgi:hypothetical protein